MGRWALRALWQRAPMRLRSSDSPSVWIVCGSEGWEGDGVGAASALQSSGVVAGGQCVGASDSAGCGDSVRAKHALFEAVAEVLVAPPVVSPSLCLFVELLLRPRGNIPRTRHRGSRSSSFTSRARSVSCLMRACQRVFIKALKEVLTACRCEMGSQ